MDQALTNGSVGDPGSALPTWREADERLLRRLGDEVATERLWRMEAPKEAPTLPRRASVLARELRRLPGGEEAVEAAIEGDASQLAGILRGGLTDASPALLHASAIYLARLATSAGEAARAAELARGSEEAARWRAVELDARVRCLSRWMALVEDRAFLTELARDISAGSLAVEDADAKALAVVDRVVDDLGRIALQGARELSPCAKAALAALARTSDAAKKVRGSHASAMARADRARAHAIDDALALAEEAIQDARARTAGAAELALTFERIRAIWHWSERDLAVEHFAVDQVTPIAWELYRVSAWGGLRQLLAPCSELYESLEHRLVARPDDIAYAAKCSQILVFCSESATERAMEWQYAERALQVCATHRNGRLVMAHLLSDHAIGVLGRSTVFSGRADVRDVTPLVERAETLFPHSKRTEEARARLDQARVRWGAHG